MSNNEDKMIHPKRLTKADIAKIKASLPKRMDLGQPRDIEEILVENKDEVCVPLSAETILSFRKYAEMLKEKNKVMNLTSITDDEGIALKHFIDSLTIASYVDEEQSKIKGRKVSLIDVGTGAGFPGIPLKINKPDLDLTLLDSLAKRLAFLEDVCRELGLENVKFVHSRAEDAGRDKKYREKFDIATARAVANLPVLCEYCLPFVKVGGYFVAYKTASAAEEIAAAQNAVKTLGGGEQRIIKYGEEDNDHLFVVIKKIAPCSKKYPRKAGLPAKEPLK